MQFGFQSFGTKKDVLEAIEAAAEKQKTKYAKDCKDNAVAIFDSTGKVTEHRSLPLPDATASVAIDALLANINEQLSHCKDEDEVSVSAQVSVSRPHPDLTSSYAPIPTRFWTRILNMIKK